VDQPWINHLPKDVPAEINVEQYSSLVDMFETAVAKYEDQPAFINMGATLTYRKLEERSRAFAAYLQNELKLEKGDRVALMMPNLCNTRLHCLVFYVPVWWSLTLTRYIPRANLNIS